MFKITMVPDCNAVAMTVSQKSGGVSNETGSEAPFDILVSLGGKRKGRQVHKEKIFLVLLTAREETLQLGGKKKLFPLTLRKPSDDDRVQSSWG